MKYKDYYQILGVERTASEEALKKAYRRLARKYHPDVSKESDATARFQEVSEAYETLRDTDKRAAYDGLGQHQAGEDFHPGSGWHEKYSGDAQDADGGIDLADLFAAFGQRAAAHRDTPHPGEDREATVHIDLEQAAHGAELNLEFTERRFSADGRLRSEPRQVRVRIPPGVTDGQKLRLRGQGSPGYRGGRAGDLYLHVSLNPHRLFRADGHDLYLDVPVTPWESALGAEAEIPTLEGRVKLKIPRGSTAGRRLRLAGKGLPRAQGGAGDLYAVLGIVVPGHLSPREEELMQQLRSASTFEPRAHFAS